MVSNLQTPLKVAERGFYVSGEHTVCMSPTEAMATKSQALPLWLAPILGTSGGAISAQLKISVTLAPSIDHGYQHLVALHLPTQHIGPCISSSQEVVHTRGIQLPPALQSRCQLLRGQWAGLQHL